MKKILMFFIICLFVSVSAFAQTKTVTGKIIGSDDNLGLPASVQIKGTTKGASADIDGNYSIAVDKGQTLVISAIGYTTQEIVVGDANVIDVTLQAEATFLSEAVVTALGITKEKKSLGYSVQEIKSEELLKNKNTNVINSLAGKIAGVNITQSSGAAGAGSNIVIRGGRSANESRDNQPLFIVDGIIYDNTTNNGGNSGTDGVTRTATTFSNRVMDINPDDIESMSVLKGAAASALYGARAADGAIIITTKKGKEGSVQVNFNSKYTYSWANRLPKQQSIYGRGFYNAAGNFDDYTTQSWGDKITGTVYDNIGDFFQGSNVFDNNVSLSGGNKNGSFFLSASYYDQSGIVPSTKYTKTTFRFNGEQKYGIVTVGANVAYSQADTKKTLTAAGLHNQDSNGIMTALYGWSRSDDMKHYLNDDGTKYRMFEGRQELANDIENPYWIINRNKLTDMTTRFTGNINANAKITEWWDVSARAGIDKYTTDAYTYRAPGGAVNEKYQNGYLAKSDYHYQYITTNIMSNMHKTFGNFDLGFLLGTTTDAIESVRQNHYGYKFVTEGTISFNNIASTNQFFADRTIKNRLVGVYGELRASYKNIVYLTVTGRNDWSSTLPVENRSYFYPSVSGSFVFTELLPKNDIISFGKIRASWANVGKTADPYVTQYYTWPVATLNGGVVGIGNSWTGGNSNLKPENQAAYEIGTELRFFNGRLGLDYAFYYDKTTEQICSPRLAQSTGYIFLTLNSGSVTNKGMELSITGIPVKTKDFTWETTLNLSGNRGRLGDFIDGVDIFYVTDVQIGGVKAGAVPYGGYFLGLTGNYTLREKDPVTGEEMKTGRKIIDAATGLYKNSSGATYVVGNREPTMIGGLNNSFTYKNFNLSFLLDLRLGGDIYNGTEYYLTQAGLSERTLNRESVTFTGVINTGTDAAPVYQDQTITYDANQTYTVNGTPRSGKYMIQQYWDQYAGDAYNFITKTNWLRLRSISLSYDFSDLLKKQSVIKGLRATITGTNLFMITNYKGMDPEVAISGSGIGGSGSGGIDYCGIPALAGFSFGINITF
jgi:TonB-linked SusC/RagA family outer membrane protein